MSNAPAAKNGNALQSNYDYKCDILKYSLKGSYCKLIEG